MAITAKMVKALREKTGAGMMDCKTALNATDGDIEGAVDWLRKKGLSAASKKSGRVAAEGKVLALSDGGRGILVEVNTETDFAAKNEKFVAFADTVAKMVLDNDPADMDALNALTYPGGLVLSEEVKNQIANVGENMNVRRFEKLAVDSGAVVSYIHMGGKIGAMVALKSEASADALAELGKKLAMHVAATAPAFLDRNSVDATALEREKAVLMDQARASGKPENIIEKMVIGRLNKFYGESCFLEQPFVVDPDMKVNKVVAAAAKEIGTAVEVVGYARLELGEGIQKKEEDFAKEVADQMGG